MLGPTEKPAARLDLRLEPTVQGPKLATASPGTYQKPVIATGFFLPARPLPLARRPATRQEVKKPANGGLWPSDGHLFLGQNRWRSQRKLSGHDQHHQGHCDGPQGDLPSMGAGRQQG